MSKIKSPDEKKKKSYESDCRNSYGENSKSSRKNIARGKQRAHMSERRVASEELRALGTQPAEELAEVVEGKVKTKSRIKKLEGFKKLPDIPLVQSLERRESRKKRVKEQQDRSES